jgi:hypothetical protein
LWGGGLITFTKDGWNVERVTLAWPEESLLLFEPSLRIPYEEGSQFYKIAVPITEVRAFGFSYSGKTLVIATSSDVSIFARR